MNYCKFHNLETYILDEVRTKFENRGYLSAEDFFCIIIWKSNRSKSIIAKNLLHHGYGNVHEAVHALTNGLFRQSENKEKLQFLIVEWGFRLPIASAILSLLYPDDFTVYDIRVCNALGDFHNINNHTSFKTIWDKYQKYLQSVVNATPDGLSLREKDRYLWGKSFYTQLTKDIENSFGVRD